MILKDIYIYPIKSLQGVRVESSLIDRFGLQFDRRWMLIDENKNFVSQRKIPQLCLFRVSMDDEYIIVRHSENENFDVAIPYYTATDERILAQVWSDVCEVIEPSKSISQIFSAQLGMSVKLVYLPDDGIRSVDGDFAFDDEQTSFSDGFPLLAISEESLDELNGQLEIPVGMERFRPNLVLSGGYPHCEDDLEYFSIDIADFKGVKPCSRCVVTTINQQSAEIGTEPLRTLSKYRMHNGKVLFGMNVLHQSIGSEIQCGDEITTP